MIHDFIYDEFGDMVLSHGKPFLLGDDSFWERQKAKITLNDLMEKQVEKYKRGEKIKCSESLLNKIKRMAIEEDMFSAPEHSDISQVLKRMRKLVKEHSA